METISIGNDFLSRTQIAQQQRERIDTWDYMKLKGFVISFAQLKKWFLN
jgi:hypothetical protein